MGSHLSRKQDSTHDAEIQERIIAAAHGRILNKQSSCTMSYEEEQSLLSFYFEAPPIQEQSILMMVPEEVLVQIFLYIPTKTLVTSLPKVCKYFFYLLHQQHFWLKKLQYLKIHISEESRKVFLEHVYNPVAIRSLKSICYYKPLNRNLLKNPCGREGLKYWKVQHGGHGLIVEYEPIGTDKVPTEAGPTQHCFVSSFRKCIRSQALLLEKVGITPWVMDNLSPQVYVSEFVAERFDCGALSNLEVKLLSDVQMVDVISTVWAGGSEERGKWCKLEHSFKDVPPSVRRISFTSIGKDTQYWAGHYGAKTTGSSVVVSI